MSFVSISCIINGGITTRYFKLKKGTRQDDPISALLFILLLSPVYTHLYINGLYINLCINLYI